MCSEQRITPSTRGSWEQSAKLERLQAADAVVIGAGAGLSTSAGYTYSGERFQQLFPDFIAAYQFSNMYEAGFYPYQTPEETWGFWSRYIYYNRYVPIPKPVYQQLLQLVEGKEYFVLTTNVDHCFQRAGFAKERLFYTQGDYGLWQCSGPCHQETYDNEAVVREMVARQRDRKVPGELVPYCPKCGRPMAMNLRSDDTFVQDAGWYRAAKRYDQFGQQHRQGKVLYLELGVGFNTPGIIKYPFWRLTKDNPQAVYACLNYGQAGAPTEIAQQSICINGDVGDVLGALK